MTEPAQPSTSLRERARRRLRSTPRATLVDGALIGVAWLFGAARILLSGVGFDDVTYATPAQQVTLDAWRHGRLALWSNTTFAGTPHLGNPQTAALYPGHLLAAPFPDLVGTHVELALHLLLMGVGFYLLGRRLHFARPAPAAMAIAAMWSGATAFRSPLLVHFPPLAWVPMAAVCIHAVVTSTRPRRAIGALALTLWCILASGHPQSVLMAFTLLGAWAVGLVIEHRAWRTVRLLAGAGALSIVMAAPMLLALRQSMHAAAAASRDSAALLNPGYVVPMRVFPRILLGEPLHQLFWLWGQGERITYAGVVVVALGFVGAVTVVLTRRWSLVALGAVGAFAATLSLGPRSPTLRFARAFLPGFDQPRVSARWNWVLVMALIVLAGAGVDRLRQGTSRRGGLAVVVAMVIVGVSALVGVETAGLGNTVFWFIAASCVVFLAVVPRREFRIIVGGAVALLAVFELGMPIARMINHGDADVTDTSQLIGPTERWLAQQTGLTQQLINGDADAAYLVAGLRPNANTLAGVRLLDGYDGGVAISRRWHAALLQINPSSNDMIFGAQVPYVLEPDAFARMGIRFVLYDPARGPSSVSLPGWKQRATTGYFQLFENPSWHGDVTAWYGTSLVDSPETAGNTLRASLDDYTEIGLVENDNAVLSCTDSCAPDSFESTSSEGGERASNVQLAHAAVVTFNEQFDEGWTATVDGKSATVIPVDGVWAGVAVADGSHHIELKYKPTWVAPSVIVMVLGWMGMAALWWAPSRRRRTADTA